MLPSEPVLAILVMALLGAIAYRLARMPPREAIEREDVVRCPTCGYDVRATPERCPECGTSVPRKNRRLDPIKLRDDWPDAPLVVREPNPGESLVIVWHAPHRIAADLLVEQLAARGIPSRITARPRPMRVTDFTPQGADVGVAVWSNDIDRVDAILARFEEASRSN